MDGPERRFEAQEPVDAPVPPEPHDDERRSMRVRRLRDRMRGVAHRHLHGPGGLRARGFEDLRAKLVEASGLFLVLELGRQGHAIRLSAHVREQRLDHADGEHATRAVRREESRGVNRAGRVGATDRGEDWSAARARRVGDDRRRRRSGVCHTASLAVRNRRLFALPGCCRRVSGCPSGNG